MSQQGFEVIVTRDEPGSVVLTVAGEIDLATAPTLAAALQRVEETAGRTVHLDLEQVTFLDSSGISVLVQSHKRIGDGNGHLILHRTSNQITRVLEISGLGTFFELSEHAPA